MADGHSILAEVRERFGITFSETMTGGGCMALEARLESGHWLVATDEGLCGFHERIEFESFGDNYNTHAGEDHRAMGWSIGIYPPDGEDGSWLSGTDSVVDVVDWDAYAAALPDMVEQALAKLAKLR